MKRLIGWAVLALRLHHSLRAARGAIAEVGRRPIRIRPVTLLRKDTRVTSVRTPTGGTKAGNLRGQVNGGSSLLPSSGGFLLTPISTKVQIL
jgi:hypothetical protein